jgi:hypothetical protein
MCDTLDFPMLLTRHTVMTRLWLTVSLQHRRYFFDLDIHQHIPF